MRPTPIAYTTRKTDGITLVTLSDAKKYTRIDGDFEDTLLDTLLAACIARVEQLNNVSLCGRRVEAVYDLRDWDLHYNLPRAGVTLPYCGQAPEDAKYLGMEMESITRENGTIRVVYTVEANTNPVYPGEVYSMFYQRYHAPEKGVPLKQFYM
jgi:hypothetical protein